MANKPDLKALMEKLNNIQLDDINNIDWENMGSWPVAGKMFFCVLLFTAILLGGYFYLVSDQIDVLEQARQKEETLKKDFESKAFRASNLLAYNEQLVEMEETFGSLLKQLPRETEVPGLIDDISAAALGAGLDLNLMDPQAMKQTEFYKELPINIEVTGGYHEMGTFVSTVSALPRIVTLHDFSITTNAQNKGNELNMKIHAKTYQYNDEAGASSQAGGRK